MATASFRQHSTSWWSALRRGFARTCPACGRGRLFTGYANLNPTCPDCETGLDAYRADDAPAYFTIVIVGHIVVPLALIVERTFSPPLWVHALIWAPTTLAFTLLILPRVKGAVIGVQWALGVRREE